jgi:adenine-specific DNA-methyltransferase
LHAKSGSSTYEVTFPNGVVWTPPKGRYPLRSKKDLYKLYDDNRLYFGKEGKGMPNQKSFLTEVKQGKTVGSIWSYSEVGSSHQSNEEVAKLIGKGVFDNPKTIKLIQAVIKTANGKDSIILDFFAGSGTTGDAVMQLNAEDGGNRNSILVQLPEKIDPKNNKTAYDFVKNELGVAEPTIFEITKERLVRSAKKIKEETINTKILEKQKEIKDLESQLDIDGKEEKIKQLKTEIKALKNQDLGFKIFETMPIWEDYNFEADELDAQTKLFDESKLTENDLKALLVTWKTYDGISLTESLQKIDLGKYTGYYTSEKLYLTNKGFKTENLKVLLEKIDSDKKFNPTSIIAFGYHFESKNLREIAENIKSYANKKNIDIDFITRY